MSEPISFQDLRDAVNDGTVTVDHEAYLAAFDALCDRLRFAEAWAADLREDYGAALQLLLDRGMTPAEIDEVLGVTEDELPAITQADTDAMFDTSPGQT